MGLMATVFPASLRRSPRARTSANTIAASFSVEHLEERTLLSGSYGTGNPETSPDMYEEEMRVNQQTEFLQMNSRYADQTVAGLRDGGFFATWTSQVQIGVDHSYAVVARRFDSTGAPVGDEFVVNQTIKGTQRFPTIYAGTTSGGQERVLIVWEAWENGCSQIKARLFDSEGYALGSEFQVNDFDRWGTRHTGSVDFLDDDTFVIAWHGRGGGGWLTYDNYGVFMRKFDYNGNALTGDILVNQTRIGKQELPSVHGLPNGDILVTWSGFGHGDWWGVYQRRFDSYGNALGGEQLVNTTTWGVQYQPTLSVAPNGSYAIGFSGCGDAYMRLYDANGVPQGSEFRLNTYTKGRQHEPAITYIGDNRIVATWSGYGPGDCYGIFKREFELEIWLKNGERFNHFATYPICRWSGKLGPKLKQGDHQAPEGFYWVSAKSLNPASRWHRSFNLGFPNTFDRAQGRTGSFLMVHGGCGSVGCYAMTNAAVDEIWRIVTAALDGGQKRFQVQALPFRMTPANLAESERTPNAPFWQSLRDGYDLFEQSRLPPIVRVCSGRYEATAAPAGTDGSTPLIGRCAKSDV